MQIAVDRLAHWTVVALEGDLNLESGPGVYLAFQREWRGGATRVLFDLTGVPALDTSGLGVLVRCFKEARSRGGEVALCGVSEPIRRVLEYTRLDSILRVVPRGARPSDDLGTEAA